MIMMMNMIMIVVNYQTVPVSVCSSWDKALIFFSIIANLQYLRINLLFKVVLCCSCWNRQYCVSFCFLIVKPLAEALAGRKGKCSVSTFLFFSAIAPHWSGVEMWMSLKELHLETLINFDFAWNSSGSIQWNEIFDINLWFWQSR